jgi:hypothetical protein
VAHGGEALGLGRELGLLQLGIGAHAALGVAAGQLEHGQVQAVEAGQRHELELVAHGADLALEARRGLDAHLALPVEDGRAVVGSILPGELAVDRLREVARILQVGVGGLPPQQVGVGRVGQAARDGVVPCPCRA